MDRALRQRRRDAADAAEQILQNVAETETSNAVYSVREAIYDGIAAYILVDITPKDEHTFLMPDGYDADLFIDDLIKGAGGHRSASTPRRMGTPPLPSRTRGRSTTKAAGTPAGRTARCRCGCPSPSRRRVTR